MTFISAKECGYIYWDVCTCDESPHAGKDCPYTNTRECPVHKKQEHP